MRIFGPQKTKTIYYMASCVMKNVNYFIPSSMALDFIFLLICQVLLGINMQLRLILEIIQKLYIRQWCYKIYENS